MHIISKNCKIIQYLSILCFFSLVHGILLRFANLGISYGLGCQVSTQAASQHPFIYIKQIQANLQLGLSDHQQIACTYINNTLISTMHLYQQPISSQANAVGFIRPSTTTHALISTINDHFQVSFPAVSSNSIQCTTPDYICLT